MNGFKDSLFVGAVPAEPSVADDMVGRYETEMAGIYRLVGIELQQKYLGNKIF